MNHEHDPTHLMARHFSGEATEAETRVLRAWRAAEPANERLFQENAALWRRLADEDAQAPPFDAVAGWRALAKRLELPENPENVVSFQPAEPFGKTASRRPRWLGWALAAAALVAALGLWRFGPSLVQPEWRRIAVAAGQPPAEVVLPDGSTATLSGGSELRWRGELKGDVREVAISGKALFVVVNSEKPFVATSEHARVRVLGTEFEVRARGDATRVVVREGRVALQPRDGPGQLILTPNELGIVKNGVLQPKRSVDAAAWLSWLDGRIVFRDVALADAFADLESRFGVPIVLAEPALGELILSASFPEDAALATVLDEICLALDLSYAREGDGYRVSR